MPRPDDVRKYRRKAAELRTISEQFSTQNLQFEFLNLAARYDDLAHHMEVDGSFLLGDLLSQESESANHTEQQDRPTTPRKPEPPDIPGDPARTPKKMGVENTKIKR